MSKVVSGCGLDCMAMTLECRKTRASSESDCDLGRLVNFNEPCVPKALFASLDALLQLFNPSKQLLVLMLANPQ